MTASMPQVPDYMLIERVIAGDESALSAIYDRYSPMLFGLLARILQDRLAAEDLLQDLFLQLWRGAGKFDASRGSLPAWLTVVARNRAISQLRGARNRELLEEKDGDYANIFVSDQNVEDEAARAELARNLTTALGTLPAEQRRTLELAYFEGMTQSEIAARTGCPLGTVKTRVRTALQSLRQIIG